MKKIFLLKQIALLAYGIGVVIMTPIQTQARSFVLICNESTSEEECSDFLSKTPEAISYKNFVASTMGAVARDLTQRVFSLSANDWHNEAQNNGEGRDLNAKEKKVDDQDEINALIKETSDGFLSQIKISLLIKLLLLKSTSKNSLKGAMNSLAAPSGLNQQKTLHSKLPVKSTEEIEESSLQIKVLTEGVIKNPGVLPLALSLPRRDDQLYINGRLIKNDMLNAVKLYPHLHYHVAYLSNTYQPYFQWARGDQISPIIKQNLIIGDCRSVIWEKSVLHTTTVESFLALFPSACTHIVSRPDIRTSSMLLNKELSKEISDSMAFNERPPPYWERHPLLTIGASILIYNLLQKELQKTSMGSFTWGMNF